MCSLKMIEQELLLLGLFKESPKHGYEIKMKIKEMLSLFTGVNLKSIYYPLRVLENKGLIIKRISKVGRRPQRFVYELTTKGENQFNHLLTKSFLDFKRPQFSLDLSLYFLNYVKLDIAKRRLRARIVVLKKLSKGFAQLFSSFKNEKPASLVHILEHNLQMVEAESQFITRLLNTIK